MYIIAGLALFPGSTLHMHTQKIAREEKDERQGDRVLTAWLHVHV